MTSSNLIKATINKLKNSTNHTLVLFSVALLIRAVFVIWFRQEFSATEDEAYYIELGHNISQGNGLSLDLDRDFQRDGILDPVMEEPITPLLIGLSIYFSGGSLLPVHFLYALMSAALVPIVFLITKQSFSARAAILSSWIICLHPMLIFESLYLRKETPLLFFASYFILKLIKSLDTLKFKTFFEAGCILSLSILSRETLFFFPFFTVFFLYWAIDAPWKNRTFYSGVFLLGVLLVIAPWTFRNWNIYQKSKLFNRMPIVSSAATEYLPLALLGLIERNPNYPVFKDRSRKSHRTSTEPQKTGPTIVLKGRSSKSHRTSTEPKKTDPIVKEIFSSFFGFSQVTSITKKKWLFIEKDNKGPEAQTIEAFSMVNWWLPPCLGSYNRITWTNCVGTHTNSRGDKYVGKFNDGKKHGQGTKFYADGRIERGVWKNNKFHYFRTVLSKEDRLLSLVRSIGIPWGNHYFDIYFGHQGPTEISQLKDFLGSPASNLLKAGHYLFYYFVLFSSTMVIFRNRREPCVRFLTILSIYSIAVNSSIPHPQNVYLILLIPIGVVLTSSYVVSQVNKKFRTES